MALKFLTPYTNMGGGLRDIWCVSVGAGMWTFFGLSSVQEWGISVLGINVWVDLST